MMMTILVVVVVDWRETSLVSTSVWLVGWLDFFFIIFYCFSHLGFRFGLRVAPADILLYISGISYKNFPGL